MKNQLMLFDMCRKIQDIVDGKVYNWHRNQSNSKVSSYSNAKEFLEHPEFQILKSVTTYRYILIDEDTIKAAILIHLDDNVTIMLNKALSRKFCDILTKKDITDYGLPPGAAWWWLQLCGECGRLDFKYGLEDRSEQITYPENTFQKILKRNDSLDVTNFCLSTKNGRIVDAIHEFYRYIKENRIL